MMTATAVAMASHVIFFFPHSHIHTHTGMPVETFSTIHKTQLVLSIGKSTAETAAAAAAKLSNVNGNVWFCIPMYVVRVSAVVSNTINESERE